MALTERIAGLAACPECGANGPYNFRFEDRISIKPALKTEGAYSVVANKRMLVCASCGCEIKKLI